MALNCKDRQRMTETDRDRLGSTQMTAWLSPSHTDHHDLSLSLPHTALRQHCASKCFPDTVQALACTALSQGSVPLNSTAAACCAGSLQPQLEINTEAHTQSTNYMGKCSWECQRGFWNRGCFAAAAVSTVGRGAQRDSMSNCWKRSTYKS